MMPLPYRLLLQIAGLLVREYRRGRQKQQAKRAPVEAPPVAPVVRRKLSFPGRLVRLALVGTALWLIWREIMRRRAALRESRATPAAPDAGARAEFRRAVAPATEPPPLAAPVAEAPVEPEMPAEPEAPVEAEMPAEPEVEAELIGWCARCRTRRPMRHVTIETTDNGRRIARGECPECGAGMTRFVAKDEDA